MGTLEKLCFFLYAFFLYAVQVSQKTLPIWHKLIISCFMALAPLRKVNCWWKIYLYQNESSLFSFKNWPQRSNRI